MTSQASWITDTEVLAHMDWKEMVMQLDQIYLDWSRGEAQLVPRTRNSGHGVTLSQMGGMWFARSVAACKTYTTVAGQFAFVVNLFALDAPVLHATFVGHALTRWRTAAQTLLMAERYFRQRRITVALIGAGLQGQAHLEAIAALLQADLIQVVDPGFDVAQAQAWTARLGVPVSCCEALHAVTQADLVITATRSSAPVFQGAWLRDDALVCAIGTSSRKGTELDATTLDRAANIWVEDQAQAGIEAGELSHWPGHEAGQGKISDLPALYRSDAQLGWRPGITVFKAVGNGLADTAAAWLAWQRIGACQEFRK